MRCWWSFGGTLFVALFNWTENYLLTTSPVSELVRSLRFEHQDRSTSCMWLWRQFLRKFGAKNSLNGVQWTRTEHDQHRRQQSAHVGIWTQPESYSVGCTRCKASRTHANLAIITLYLFRRVCKRPCNWHAICPPTHWACDGSHLWNSRISIAAERTRMVTSVYLF